ncbi:MAG: SAM-dependent methyltransferase [Tannerellaceae bacterium]|jgi:pimeloyl-ACP methyl ester carboxylesterase|nr:SAM-dependent methyltransferase [Tannerellaceae bacterium]
MKTCELTAAAQSLAVRLQAIDYDSLPISDYNKRYIRSMRPAFLYYLEIYAGCLRRGISATGQPPASLVMVDYGGGSGFLSMLAKEVGIGRVVYIDLNPLSVETIHVLKQQTGCGPDDILSGDTAVLAAWCAARQIKPQLLIATDLIEHVYDLKPFFAALAGINERLSMIFTTASTPYNPWVKRRLRRFMKGCESGGQASPGYYAQREQFIRTCRPSFSAEMVDRWSRNTRGLIYADIEEAIDRNRLPVPGDAFNTCDPATGNWAERILPVDAYRRLLAAFRFSLTVDKGHYNVHRRNRFTAFICRCVNLFIRYSGKAGFLVSPYIILSCSHDSRDFV